MKSIHYICKYAHKGSEQAIFGLQKDCETSQRLYFSPETLHDRVENPRYTTLTAFFQPWRHLIANGYPEDIFYIRWIYLHIRCRQGVMQKRRIRQNTLLL